MHPVFQSSRRDFTFGPWKLSAARTHIMKSAQAERTFQSSEIIGGNVPVSASST